MIVVLGASGYTGRLVCAALAQRGVEFVAAGRDPARVRAVVAGLPGVADVLRADVQDPPSLARALAGAAVVVTTVGPFVELGRPVVEAALASGCHYVDTTGEQVFLRWLHTEVHPRAEAAGVTLLPACGFDFVPGDLLAAVALGALPEADTVEVVYAVGGRVVPSRGTRRSILAVLGSSAVALEDGRLVEEPPGAATRLVSIPGRGPSRVRSIPGGEVLSVPRHHPQVRTVRTYLAIPGGELVGVLAGALRAAPLRRLLSRVVAGGPEGPADRHRQRARWVCVTEARSASDRVRAWAEGRDPYGFTAEAVADAATTLRAGGTPAGVVAPAQIRDAGRWLDELGARTGLRWSLAHGGGSDEAGRAGS